MIGLRALRDYDRVTQIRDSSARHRFRSRRHDEGACRDVGGAGSGPATSLEQMFWRRRYDDSTVDDDMKWFQSVAECVSHAFEEPRLLSWRASAADPQRPDDLPPILWRAQG